jgi:hypothetical protein
MLLAVQSASSYFSSWAQDQYNLGMVLTPDSNHTVKWQIAYSEAREVNPVFRNADWLDSLFGSVTTLARNPANQSRETGVRSAARRKGAEYFSISGRKIIGDVVDFKGITNQLNDIFIVRYSDGTMEKRLLRNR